MTAIQSALFEFTIEVYTEPASVQDLYITPVVGAVLGFVLEEISIKLLNQDFFLWRGIGHLINPLSLFGFYEGKVKMIPSLESASIGNGHQNKIGLTFYVDF